MTAPIKVFWQPWCTSCLRVREFLSSRGVGFESINVLEDEGAMAELGRLGARSVPVVSRGEEFVFAQSIREVVGFLGLDAEPGPELSPRQLVERLDVVLAAAGRYTLQMPDSELETQMLNRPRSYRALLYHIFRIPDAFLEMTRGAGLTYEMLTAPPPAALRTTADLAAYGEGVRQGVSAWWHGRDDKTCAERVETYYGAQPLHEVLERTTWHPCQHVRQLMSLLERLGIRPDRPLTAEDLAGLPLPEGVWDE
jgi:glutaredoxin